MNIPTNLIEAKKLLEDKMMEVLFILESKIGKAMPIPLIQFDRLGGRVAVAKRGLDCGCRIVINTDMITESRWNEMLNNTLPHEICHHIAPLIYNQYVHGYDKHEGWSHKKAWQQCMRMLGLSPDRCTTVSTEEFNQCAKRVVLRKYAYQCGCADSNTHFLTAIKHKRIQLGKYNRLHCIKCNVTLTYVGEKLEVDA